jgi:hypothetical protein
MCDRVKDEGRRRTYWELTRLLRPRVVEPIAKDFERTWRSPNRCLPGRSLSTNAISLPLRRMWSQRSMRLLALPASRTISSRATDRRLVGEYSAPAPVTQTPAAAVTSPELVRQLEPMTRDLAVVRRSLEQLAAKQEQMAQSIATLQAVEQDIRQKMSSPPPSRAVPKPPRKPPQPAAQSSAVLSSSVPPPPPAARSPFDFFRR